MKRAMLLIFCTGVFARNPFVFIEEKEDQRANAAVADGVYDGACIEVICSPDGSLTLMIEKIPSTLGKAEGLGG